MTKRYQEVRKTAVYKEVTALICDICGTNAKIPGNDYNDPWHGKPYAVSKVELVYEEGTRYPEGTNVTRTSFDICPTCYKEKLVPFIKTFGGQPTTDDLDY